TATKNRSNSSKSWVYRVYRAGLLLFALAVIAFFFLAPDLVAWRMNTVHTAPPYPHNDATENLYARLFIADLHADTLLWNRDLLQRGHYGHIDLPRLLEANTGIQVFSAVTKTPRGINFERNDASSDNITPLVIAQRWPWRTWDSLTERALHQANRLRQLADRSAGRFVVIRSRADLDDYVDRRRNDAKLTAGILALEGLHALDGDLGNLIRLNNAGFRMMGLTHFFDNAIGGSVHGVSKGGLTNFGRAVINEMEQLGIIIDLAHASPQLVADVLETASTRVVVSHTGVKGTCARTRNLSDQQLRAIGKNGGLVGIAFFEEAICGTDVGAIVRAIRYTANLIGVDHVALGSDFDGAVTTPFDVTGLRQLTTSLVHDGFSPADVEAIMGGNVVSLLKHALPKGQ
ncbi:MAG: dipeptidase, partial [Gammaproteobacteria bacterium]